MQWIERLVESLSVEERFFREDDQSAAMLVLDAAVVQLYGVIAGGGKD